MQSQITQEEFDDLLQWLDLDRDTAAMKYEEIRRRLELIFLNRGFNDAEDLADETINRVIKKFPELKNYYTGDPDRYFYGVAKKVISEALRRKDRRLAGPPLSLPSAETEVRMRLLDECLTMLPADDQHLLLMYYEDRGAVKIDNRKRLGHSLGLSQDTIRQRVHRLRMKLKTALLKRLREEEESF